jgi:hypothetical protein
MKLDFRDSDPVVIDLSPKGGRVEGLQESKVECLVNDKVRSSSLCSCTTFIKSFYCRISTCTTFFCATQVARLSFYLR